MEKERDRERERERDREEIQADKRIVNIRVIQIVSNSLFYGIVVFPFSLSLSLSLSFLPFLLSTPTPLPLIEKERICKIKLEYTLDELRFNRLGFLPDRVI